MDFRAPTLGSAVHVGMACGLLEKDYVAGIDQWKEEYLQKHILEIADGVDELIAETTGCLNQEIEDMTNEVTSTAKEITGRALKVFGPAQWEPVLFNKAPMVEIELRVPIRGCKDVARDQLRPHDPATLPTGHDELHIRFFLLLAEFSSFAELFSGQIFIVQR